MTLELPYLFSEILHTPEVPRKLFPRKFSLLETGRAEKYLTRGLFKYFFLRIFHQAASWNL